MVSRPQADVVPPQTTGSKAIRTAAGKNSILQMQAEERKVLLDEYFERTKLLKVIEGFMAKLATAYKTQLRLPANPYPELLKGMRMHELRQTFALQRSDDSSSSLELAALNGQAQVPDRFLVCSVEHEQFALPIWGAKLTLEQLTGANLYPLLDQMYVSFRGLVSRNEFTDEECRVNAYGVLVGDSILGTRSEHLPPPFLDLETHVFVSGVHLEKAMGVFARFLLKQLHEVSNATESFASLSPEEAVVYRGCVAYDGITIAPQASSSTELSGQHTAATVWDIERVTESRSAFISAVKTALVSNSLVTLTRYELAQLATRDKSLVCQVEQTFFFHFAAEDKAKLTGVSTPTSRQSFMVGSRALTSGLFFDSNGALEVASRFRDATLVALKDEEATKLPQRKKQTAVADSSSVMEIPEARPRSGFIGVLNKMMNELRRMELPNDAFRECTYDLAGCFAYSLGNLVQAHQALMSVLCHSTCSVAAVVMVQTSFMSLETWMKRFLVEIEAFPPTSVLYPVCSLLRQFNDQIQAASELKDDRQIEEFIEALRRLDELLMIVVLVTFEDFLGSVKTSFAEAKQAATNASEVNQQDNSSTLLGEIDVLRALEMAVEERRYPATIVSELVFAQAIVDSCLDMALESAVMNTVAVRLPPNPFIDVSINLQVFALRQLVWRCEMQQTEQQSIIQVSSRPDLFSIEGANVCAVNPKLLGLVKVDQVSQAQEGLVQHGIFHENTYKPSKSSYSIAVFQTMLIFHPLLFAQPTLNDIEGSAVLKELDVVEHYVVEGKDAYQAREFFLEAVHTDIRRLEAAPRSPTGKNCWLMHLELQVLDTSAQVAAAMDLFQSPTDESIHTLVEEAMRPQCMLQVLIQLAEVNAHEKSRSLTISEVTKVYAFHYHPTNDHVTDDLPTHLPPLLLFRISEYGVFFSRQNAMLYFKGIESDCEGPKISRKVWTPSASRALELDDSFLMYELHVVHESETPLGLQQRDLELTNRLLAHSDICQLYSLEQTIKWLLDALQNKQGQVLVSKTHTGAKSTALPETSLFRIHHPLALFIIARIEKLVNPLNDQLPFLHKISDLISRLRTSVARWQSIQPPTESALEHEHKQQEKTPGSIPLTPREDPVDVTNELVDTLRTTWILVMFFRYSYQCVFFANANSKRE